jgi:soluble lytic murein transglycosylase
VVGRRKGRAATLGLLALLLAPAPAAAGGGLYRWVDARGVVHFTNVPKDDRWKVIRPPRGLTVAASGPRRPVRLYDPLISRAADIYGVPAAMVKAVIHAESSFNPRAVSRKGAMGLMQLMPDTARDLGVREPFREEENVLGGTRYLRTLRDRYSGSWTHALAAYNAGPSTVDRYQGVPPFAETREYVNRVLSYYRRYHGDFSR